MCVLHAVVLCECDMIAFCIYDFAFGRRLYPYRQRAFGDDAEIKMSVSVITIISSWSKSDQSSEFAVVMGGEFARSHFGLV